jgi:hypothetical protein
MDKLEPETVLMLVEETFIDSEDREVHAGSLARIARGAKVARGRYLYVGSESADVYHLRFMSDDNVNVSEEIFVDANELTRAFTLAADYYLTMRPVFDTPRKR